MPELTAIHIGLIAGMLVIGLVLGWVFRGDRCAKEKMAVNASWQEQIESQQSEHNRLAEQNKSLMEQISQYQASHRDSANRAKELSDSLRESFARRDELQRQVKEMRGNLELVLAQRDKLKNAVDNNNKRGNASAASFKDKDDKIFRLSRELTSWQSRVPPLVEKYQERDKRVHELEAQLDIAESRIAALEVTLKTDQTRIEPVDRGSLPSDLDASNEQYAATSAHEVSTLHDQIRQSADANTASYSKHTEQDYMEFDAAAELASVNDFIDDEEAEPASEIHFADQAKDDLKEIKGVGPAIEKTLNDLGIYHFNQIAEMSEYDIDRVAQQLKGFRSRIYREDWIGQARDLQYRKQNELS
jgi:predicted flap endonuclease-1-like 5' DNA nuclease